MWNNIERSQLRLGPRNWLDSGCVEKIRAQSVFLTYVKICFHIARNYNYKNVEIRNERKREFNFGTLAAIATAQAKLVLCADGRMTVLSLTSFAEC